MAEYTIGVCPTCGGVSHLDKPSLVQRFLDAHAACRGSSPKSEEGARDA